LGPDAQRSTLNFPVSMPGRPAGAAPGRPARGFFEEFHVLRGPSGTPTASPPGSTMSHLSLLPAIDGILKAIRTKQSLDEVLHLILEKACHLAQAAHGSFALVDHETGRLTLSNVYGSDWTTKKRLCQLSIGHGLTGKVAASGQARLCRDTRTDPDYFELFSYVRSELVVPVLVKDRVWGVINIDGRTPDAFGDDTLELLSVFAELASSAITFHLEVADQDRLYRKLVQSEKLASLGEALAGIAHEINNPLTSILGYSSLLSQAPSLGPSEQRAATVIAAEAQRAAGLIRGLLDFSRKETGARELIDAHTLVQKAANLKRYQLRQSNVKLQVSRPDETCPVYVCTQQITQVLHNLITNAEQAMPKGPGPATGLIRIAVERKPHVVRIVVSDNGTGVPAVVRDRIFDPFFTTKAPGEGTGLGLSICHTIMAAHEGAIQLAESSANGTTFVLELPPAEASAVNKPESLPPFRRPGTPENPTPGRILIVDDEPHIAEALSAFLTQQRFDVSSAPTATAALELLAREKYDLILSDVRMPGMDGLEFHEAASRNHPRYKQRFIFMSGYLMQERVKAHLAGTGLPCLEKPFSFDELGRTVSRHLATLEAMTRN
jgi:two-component system NtrC family sensor kinase